MDDWCGWRQKSANTALMDVGVFVAGAVSRVDRILPHHESIVQEHFAKFTITAPSFVGVDRQIKCSDDPHGAISSEGNAAVPHGVIVLSQDVDGRSGFWESSACTDDSTVVSVVI